MVYRTPFAFFRGDLRLAGRLFRNTDRFDVRQPAIMMKIDADRWETKKPMA
jgi:hypothetical protein